MIQKTSPHFHMKKKILIFGSLFLFIVLASLIVINPETIQGRFRRISRTTATQKVKTFSQPVDQKFDTMPIPSNLGLNLFDKDGRISDTARSFGKMSSLKLNKLTEIHPEDYGNNYYSPGTYVVEKGDGIGNGIFLIKFMEFKNKSSLNAQIRTEVFKKEKDGNYYHFPTNEYTLSMPNANQLFDINIELLDRADYLELPSDQIKIIYHQSCQTFIDYCDDETHQMYAWEDTTQCNKRCPFTANTDQYQAKNGKYSTIFPEGSEELADTVVDILKQCDENTEDFLKIKLEKPRLGVQMLLGSDNPTMTGLDEYISGQGASSWFEYFGGFSNQWKEQAKTTKCPNVLELGHELIHVYVKDFFGTEEQNIYGLEEGLANFARYQNGVDSEIICRPDGWSYTYNPETTNPYVTDISGPPNANEPYYYFYHTGYCFWHDFVNEYSYGNLTKVMQALYQQVRDIKSYYVLDVIEHTIGEKLSQEILDRYSLEKNQTFVDVCKGCEIF